MLYYYANSGHKIGLDRVRRGVGVIKKLKEEGIDAELLVNDFRAGMAAKELGVDSYITIETIQDIDAVASPGASVIIDSSEDEHGRLVKFCADFKNVWRYEHSSDDYSIHGEILLRENSNDDSTPSSVMVDESYTSTSEKVDRTLFFFSDADYDKVVLKNRDFFKESGMELLLGNYFFVKYEDELSTIFPKIHESEEYQELFMSSKNIVTASAQSALEAKACGANVFYVAHEEEPIYSKALLEECGVVVLNRFAKEEFKKINKNDENTLKELNCNINKIKSQL